MSRRIPVAIAIAAFAAATVVHAETASPRVENEFDRACTTDGTAHLVPAHDELTALFARPALQADATENDAALPMGPPEVLMARFDADGKLVVVCVDNEEAARRFLEAPAESISHVRIK
jgi:NAD(P)H-dependent flavin oxidoreductase YrpB (nitropropane dioxygenase family)